MYVSSVYAWGVEVSSIISCAPDARLGRGTFGARFAISYAVVIFLTTSSAITVLPSDCLGVVLVWRGRGPSSLIGVHVLRLRDSKPFAMNLFILSVTGCPFVRFEVWLLTELARLFCLFVFTFHV